MLIAQADGIELLPEMSELVWGVSAVVLLVAPIVVFIGLVVWVKRAVQRRQQDLEARVRRLEDHILEGRSPKP